MSVKESYVYGVVRQDNMGVSDHENSWSASQDKPDL